MYQYLVIGRDKSYFVNSHSKYDNKYTKNEIVQFSERMFQQTIDIPMGNNFASLLADLFLHAYDADFLWQRHI
jgi:hypothetical protein